MYVPAAGVPRAGAWAAARAATASGSAGVFPMRSLELLGLASFNLFLGMILTVTFISQGGQPKSPRLTEENVSAFIHDMTDTALGLKPGMDQYATTMWFMDHLSEASTFKTNMNIEQAQGGTRAETVEMGRMDYIGQILKDQKAVQKRESHVNIEYVKIEEDGNSAAAVFTSIEKGMISMTSDAGTYEMPVRGTSFCEHRLALRNKKIVVSGGTCTTHVDATQVY